MDGTDLQIWKRFALKGGIGKCTAVADCVAEEMTDLMFYEGDEIVVLMQLEGEDDLFLGYCEDVIGRFKASDVRFHGRLKKPIAMKRSSSNNLRASTSSQSHSPATPSPSTSPAPIDSTPRQTRDNSPTSTPLTESESPSLRGTATASPDSTSPDSSFASPPRLHDKSRNSDGFHQDHISSAHGFSLSPDSLPPPLSLSANTSTTDSISPLTPYPQNSPSSMLAPDSISPLDALKERVVAGRIGQSIGVVSALMEQAVRRDSSTTIEGSIRDSRPSSHSVSHRSFSSTRSSQPPHPYDHQFASIPEDDSMAFESRSARSSVAFSDARSDGEEGIGMQFIQGLINSSSSGVIATSSEGHEAIGERPLSTWSEESLARPSWRRSSSVEGEAQESGARQLSEDKDFSDNGSRTSSPEPSHYPNEPSLIPPESPPRSPEMDDSRRSHSPQSHSSGSASNYDEPHSPQLETRPSAYSEPPMSPGGDGVVDDEPQEDMTHEEVETWNDERADSGTDEDDVGGYYEQDEDIYDDYRYSRYSMMSRKSRKSVIPHFPPPPPDSFASMNLPSPPFKSLGTSQPSSSSKLVPAASSPTAGTSILDEEDRRSFKSSPSISTSLMHGRRIDQVDEDTLHLPAAFSIDASVKPRLMRRSTDESSQSSTKSSRMLAPPLSPIDTSGMPSDDRSSPLSIPRSPLLASALRQQIELETAERASLDDGRLSTEPIDQADPARLSQADQEWVVQEELSRIVLPGEVANENDEEGEDFPRMSSAGSVLAPKQDERYNEDTGTPAADSTVMVDSPEAVTTDLPRLNTNLPPVTKFGGLNVLDTPPGPGPTPLATKFDENRPFVQATASTSTTPVVDSQPSNEVKTLTPRLSALEALEGRSPRLSSPSSGIPEPHPALVTPTAAGPLVSPSGRPLTFLPHPNAPKPVTLVSAPSQPSIHALHLQDPQNRPANRPSPSLYNALAGAVAHARAVPPVGGIRRVATIHGRTEYDLLTAMGPVRIDFVLDREGRGPPPRAQPYPHGNTPLMPRTPMNLSSSPGTMPSLPGTPSSAVFAAERSIPESGVGLGINIGADMHASVNEQGPEMDALTSPTSPQPRAKFFPKGEARPRSNSFSGFTARFVEVPLPIESKTTNDSPTKAFRVPTLRSMRLAQSANTSPSLNTSLTLPSERPPPSSPTPARSSPKTPTPLILTKHSSPSIALRSPPPSSPLAQPPISPASFQDSSLRAGGSLISTKSLPSSSAAPFQPTSSPLAPPHVLRGAVSTSGLRNESIRSVESTQPQSLPSSVHSSPHSAARSMSLGTPARQSQSDTPPGVPLTVVTSHQDDRSNSLSVGRAQSLRSKISLSALKSRPSPKFSTRDVSAPSDFMVTTGTSPNSPLNKYEFAEETVQVKEGNTAAEFELIRPPISTLMMRPSQDTIPIEAAQAASMMERLSLRSDSKMDSESHRSASPSISGKSQVPGAPPATGANVDAAAVEAHRARELKWISAMSTIPSGGARKNKKIKKLVNDGVPNSVRSVVWLYLTDSKSRRMKGLYTQLCARGRVAATPDIERDAERCFPNHPHLQDPKGPIITLLQAYIAMVPDLQYSEGLAAVAGTILLQSPEEDAFWTFLALMDKHLRGYFAFNSLQMDVDSVLFTRAVETADSALAKRLFTELRIQPIDVCRPWFSSLFAITLPPSFLYRVWDFFICEGVTFLFRIGLAILLRCRKYLVETRDLTGAAALAYLARPPPEVWPADAESFLTIASSVKVKEDDLRKLRGKVETTLKQQQSATISRPKLQGKEVRTLKPTST